MTTLEIVVTTVTSALGRGVTIALKATSDEATPIKNRRVHELGFAEVPIGPTSARRRPEELRRSNRWVVRARVSTLPKFHVLRAITV